MSVGEKIRKLRKSHKWDDHVPIKASVLLNPIKVYSLFGKVPLALLLHLLVIIIDGWYLLYTATDQNEFTRPSKIFLYTKFLQEDAERDEVAMTTQRTYYSVGDF